MESSVVPVLPSGRRTYTLVVVDGQVEEASFPVWLQIFADTCTSQDSVGTVPSLKYSVITWDPRGSLSHRPATASLPDFLQICTVVMASGCTKSVTGSSEWILVIMAFHRTFA